MMNFAKGLGLGLLIGYAGMMTIAAGTMVYIYNESHQRTYQFPRYGVNRPISYADRMAIRRQTEDVNWESDKSEGVDWSLK